MLNHTRYINDVRLSTLLPTDVDAVITRGIDYLDSRYVREGYVYYWPTIIDLTKLDMSSSTLCVLGQLEERDFFASQEWLTFGVQWCRAHGFCTVTTDMIGHRELTVGWRRRVGELLAT